MSTNCLVTKLKGVVNNENLSYLGKILISINDSKVLQCGVGIGNVISSPNGTFSISGGGGDNVSDVTSHTFIEDHATGYMRIVPSVNNQKFFIGKYNLYFLRNVNPTDQTEHCTLALRSKDIETIQNEFVCSDVDTDLNIEDVVVSDTLELLNIGSNESCIGDISRFDIKNIKELTILGTNITGDLKAMAELSWANGRKSGYTRLRTLTGGESEQKRVWGNQTVYSACGNYNPWIVFTDEGVSLSATQPE